LGNFFQYKISHWHFLVLFSKWIVHFLDILILFSAITQQMGKTQIPLGDAAVIVWICEAGIVPCDEVRTFVTIWPEGWLWVTVAMIVGCDVIIIPWWGLFVLMICCSW
jgi:hypothetical protein